jgi:hypothetical protein
MMMLLLLMQSFVTLLRAEEEKSSRCKCESCKRRIQRSKSWQMIQTIGSECSIECIVEALQDYGTNESTDKVNGQIKLSNDNVS